MASTPSNLDKRPPDVNCSWESSPLPKWANINTLSTFNTNTYGNNVKNQTKSSFYQHKKTNKNNISFDIAPVKYERTFSSGFNTNTNRYNNFDNNFHFLYTDPSNNLNKFPKTIFDINNSNKELIYIPHLAPKMSSIFTDFTSDEYTKNISFLTNFDNEKSSLFSRRNLLKQNEIKRRNSLEKNLLSGFKTKEESEENFGRKKHDFLIKKRTAKSIYLKESDLMKKVNKIAYDLEEIKSEKNLRRIMQEKANLKIYEKIKFGKNK